MKNALYLFILLCCPLFIFGQTSNSAIDIVGGFGYTNVKGSGDLGLSDKRGKLQPSIGISYNQRLTDKIFLKAGIRFAQFGTKTELMDNLQWGSEHDGEGGWGGPQPGLAHEVQLFYNYTFLNVPIAIRYEFNDKKLSPFAEIGFAPAFNIGSKVKQVTDLGTTKEELSGMSQVNLFTSISVGLKYKVNKQMAVTVQPVLEYQLNKLYDSGTKQHLGGLRLEAGLRYSL